MFTSKEIENACIRLDLDPDKIGDNFEVRNSKFVHTDKNIFDLTTVNFPADCLEQVEKIGQIIFNLSSQKNSFDMYDLNTNSEKEKFKQDHIVDTFLPTLNHALDFWFKKGLERIKSNKKFIFLHGMLYEVDISIEKNLSEIFV